MPTSVTLALNEERTTVQIDMPPASTMTAETLSEFITLLATTRAAMAPPVSEQTLPVFRPADMPTDRWHVTDDPENPAQIRLHLRHVGYGWVWVALAPHNLQPMLDECARMMDLLPRPE